LAPTFTPNGALSETLAQGEEEPGSSTLGALPPALAELPEASFEPELAEPESKRSDARGGGVGGGEHRVGLGLHRALAPSSDVDFAGGSRSDAQRLTQN
jgi:hypothetical protein